MRNIIDQSNYVVTDGDLLDQTEDPPVQRDGYRTIEDQVREFELAGNQLEEYRRLQYQYEGPGAEDIDSVSLFDDPDTSPADIVNARRRKIEAAVKKVEVVKVEDEGEKKEEGDAGTSVVDSGS